MLDRRRVERRRATGDNRERSQRRREAVRLDVVSSQSGDLRARRLNSPGV